MKFTSRLAKAHSWPSQRELSVRRLLEEFPLSRGEDVQVRVQGSVHALPSLHFESSK